MIRPGALTRVTSVHHLQDAQLGNSARLDRSRVGTQCTIALFLAPSPPRYQILDMSPLPVTPGERAIVEAANMEAASFHPEYIGNEHLLLALLRGADSPVSQLFSHHGFTHEAAITHLRAVFPEEA